LLSSDFGLKPCIRLGIRWRANESADFVPRVPRTAYAIFSLPAFSLAVIDSEASHEVLEVSVQNVDIRYWESQETTETSVNVLWLQIDNQLPQSAAPVILCPTRTVAAQPVMRFLMQKNNLLSQNRLNSYETVELIVQELDIFLEQKQVVASWELVRNWVGVIEPAAGDSASSDGWGSLTLGMTPPKDIRVSPARNESLSGIRRINSSELPVIRSSVVDAALENSKIYIEHLTINSIKINVSFIMSPNVQLGGHRPEAVKTFFSGDVSNVGYACSMLLRQIGDIVLDLTSAVTDAPIVLNGLEVVHLFKKDTELAKTLQDHYLNSFLMQMYKIVGSLDLVGNPIGLVSSLGTGVRDFFFEPAHALITNPTEIRKIGRGVVKGTMSLVSNVSGGTIGTLSTFTKAAGRAVARLSGGDSAFSKRREELMRHPKSVAAAVTRPIRDIENGIYGGLIGLIKVPYNGARRSGVYGFVTGEPVGVVGVVAKPVVGLLDAVSHITESLGDAVNVLTKETHAPLRRRRLSNLFGYVHHLGFHVPSTIYTVMV
jgi:vacuolar protein sorting-associated protein 13A/C